MGDAIFNRVLKCKVDTKLPPRAVAVDWLTASVFPEVSFPMDPLGRAPFPFVMLAFLGCTDVVRCTAVSLEGTTVPSLRPPLHPGPMPSEDLFHLASLCMSFLEEKVSLLSTEVDWTVPTVHYS